MLNITEYHLDGEMFWATWVHFLTGNKICSPEGIFLADSVLVLMRRARWGAGLLAWVSQVSCAASIFTRITAIIVGILGMQAAN